MSKRPSSGIFEGIKDELEANIDARLRLLKLETTEKVSRVTGIATVSIIAGTLLLLMLLCISLMAGFYFAQVFGSEFYGFALVAGFYLLLFIILIAFGRKKLATFIADGLVKTILDKSGEETI